MEPQARPQSHLIHRRPRQPTTDLSARLQKPANRFLNPRNSPSDTPTHLEANRSRTAAFLGVGHTLFTMSNNHRSSGWTGGKLALHRSECGPTAPTLVEAIGIEPTTPCLQSRCSPTELRPRSRGQETIWWAREDLNFRPHAYQARALTN
jgi:hypothetical protein